MSIGLPKIGVSLAVHNAREHVYECLDNLLASGYSNLFIVVVDDGSSDGTWELLRDTFPQVNAIRGDGNLWWTGGTNRGITECLEHKCDYILLLNPDVTMKPGALMQLVDHALANSNAIIGSVVVNRAHPDRIWWAGSRWGPPKWWLPVWIFSYLYKHGSSLDCLPTDLYQSADVHGRGVLIPCQVFTQIGLYDEKVFPHYGADSDFSLRARKFGFPILLASDVCTYLHVGNTGIQPVINLKDLAKKYWSFLFERKASDFARVSWRLLTRHAPKWAVLPSYIAWLLLASYRFWVRGLRQSLDYRKGRGVGTG